MSYNARSGSGYGNNHKGSRSFHSGKKQKFADQIAQEKKRLEQKIAAGEVGDMSYVHGAIDAYTKVENMIPLDSVSESEHSTKDPVKVQCPRDNTVFEPIVSDSVYGGLPGSGKSIWCPKCGATFNHDASNNKWANGPQALTILE